ncbi:hypothetical protein ACOSP7_026685 [Xanthoceras sorbifolium]
MDLGCSVEWVESDASNVINAVLETDLNLGLASHVFNDIKALCRVVGVVKCQAISHKRNGLAYSLASLACSSFEDRSWFNVEPDCSLFSSF